MAGARSLWRATGMKDDDFSKPIIAVVNSFTQFVPGHVHLKDLGQLVAREIEAAGGVAKEFNTIAVDDGIAMGHDGMLYSLPSRDIIADSVEYMVNAHCADAMVCISNCDKITPGMLMAAMRLNIPVVFVSGGPMEAGKVKLANPGDLAYPMPSYRGYTPAEIYRAMRSEATLRFYSAVDGRSISSREYGKWRVCSQQLAEGATFYGQPVAFTAVPFDKDSRANPPIPTNLDAACPDNGWQGVRGYPADRFPALVAPA